MNRIQYHVGDIIGQRPVNPDASKRRIVGRTVEGAAPTRRAISGLGIPAALNLITSRTWRITSLSVGIQVPPSPSRKAGPYRSQKRPRHPGRHHPGMVGEIISEWRVPLMI